MDIQNFINAKMQALVNHDTEAIKGILRQDLYTDYIFPSVTNRPSRLSTPNLFRRVSATIPVLGSSCPFHWKFSRQDSLGNILLHLAAKISDYELAKLLLEKGADITSVDACGRTALHTACKKKSLEMIKVLTKKSSEYIIFLDDVYGNSPLDIACRYSTPEVVHFLLLKGRSVLVKGFSLDGPLLNSVYNIAEYATQIASLLLNVGTNINYSTDALGTALIAAVRESVWKTRVKISAGQRGTEENSTTCQSYSYIDLLIHHGCDVNSVNPEGQTALHIAVKTKQEMIVRKLIISGVDVDKRDVYGFTPIYYACKNGSLKIVDLLIVSGTNLRAQDWETVLKRWRSSLELNKKTIKTLNYIMYKSKQCLTLENLCNITIRKNIRNVEKDSIHLGLPPLLLKRLQIKE